MGHEAIGASDVWRVGYTGAGIGIAILDIGVNGSDNTDLEDWVVALMLDADLSLRPDQVKAELI